MLLVLESIWVQTRSVFQSLSMLSKEDHVADLVWLIGQLQLPDELGTDITSSSSSGL